ncbi:BF3164 family lipoprotein [Parabacteroides bouchesdurhonensis]|uniref:BF3164 family lipoprotein n=1 Tax=Parabacteroides bouchesdurhonensis TaxID=1936995 RepID=UPI000C8612C8|nr:BF3164 family lipoprotein [Parabacteroides bouchesdurhonensis]
MKHFLYILLIVCGLVSCNKNKLTNPRYTGFPVEEALKAQVISLDTVLFRYPYRVMVKDSIAIVMDLHNADHFYHAFTYPKWEHITSFGKRGEAPEEMLSGETFHFYSLDSIWALDANKMEITRWSISPAHKSAERVETIKLDKALVRTLDFSPMDSCFLVPDYLGKYRYDVVSKEGKLIKSEGFIPTENNYEDISLPALAQAWRTFIDYNPQNGVLAMVTQLGEVLEIYNLKDGTHSVFYGPQGEPVFRIIEGDCIPTGIMGFSNVKVTDKYIYTVFHNRSFKDIGAAYKRGEKPESGGRFIYVFNLKGEPVKKYILDHAIQCIDVNEQTGTIIATDVNHDEPIIEFRI